MKKFNPITLAAVLLLLALLVSVVAMYRAATGRLSVYWLDQNMTSLSVAVPFALLLTLLVKRGIRKVKLFISAVKFIWNNKNA